jgi:hypothetical protein
MKKMNMVEKFGAIKAMLNGERVEGFSVADAVKFLDDRIEKVNAKNAKGGADRKPTKTQLENEGIKAQIVEVLSAADQPMSIGDIGKEIGIPSNQKVSALVTQLVKAKAVVRTEVKGRAYFALPTEVAEVED